MPSWPKLVCVYDVPYDMRNSGDHSHHSRTRGLDFAMSWFGLGRRKVTRKELADLIAKFTLDILTHTVSNRFVPDATRAGSPLDAASIIRECYYLLQFGTSLSLMRAMKPEVATEVLQHVADAATPELYRAGLWPAEDSARLSVEYSARREEFVRALEGLPDEVIADGLEAVLFELAPTVTGPRLQLPAGAVIQLVGALGGLAYGQFTSVTTILQRVRVTPPLDS